jgi:predicted RNA-binding protein with PUA-like domain
MKKYWLFKSEPSEFSWDDLKRSNNQTTFWDGIRNYQARNFLRDEIKIGDGVLFYQSSTDPLAVVGYCEVVKEGYADHTQFDKKNDHFDAKAKKDSPTWFMVDIKLVKEFKEPVTMDLIKANPKLKSMKLIQRGQRLSIQPVVKNEWDEILNMGS